MSSRRSGITETPPESKRKPTSAALYKTKWRGNKEVRLNLRNEEDSFAADDNAFQTPQVRPRKRGVDSGGGSAQQEGRSSGVLLQSSAAKQSAKRHRGDPTAEAVEAALARVKQLH